MNCRFCQNNLNNIFIDLYNSPPSNDFLSEKQLNEGEVYYPLLVYVCEKCFLVQLDEFKKAEQIFSSDYVYFSSYSSTWLKHCKDYSEKVIGRFALNEKSLVAEIASNDGYLLQYFLEKNIPVLGIEPTKSTADVALSKGIQTITEFFGTSFAKKQFAGTKADLLVGNNVLAHVPDINDFAGGLKAALKDFGVITMEFPHLLRLIQDCQFDTIYHEHFSYLSLVTVEKIFAAKGLTIFDVEEIPTHGGSLRIYAQHTENNSRRPVSPSVETLRQKETSFGLTTLDTYKSFTERVDKIKFQLLNFISDQKLKGKSIAAYGAAAKGNTLLNFCGIKKDSIRFVVDLSPHKQGKFLPGSHIPVVAENEIRKQKPEYIIILPWNIKDEIMNQLSYISEWNGKFVIAIPGLTIIDSKN